MRKILVPLDGSTSSNRGLKKAIELAKKDQSEIIGIHISFVSPSYALSKAKVTKFPKGVSDIVKNAQKLCEKQGVQFKGELLVGSDPAYDIVKFSQKTKPNLIVMGARGMSTLKKIFIGSVSDYVLQKSKVPVLLVK